MFFLYIVQPIFVVVVLQQGLIQRIKADVYLYLVYGVKYTIYFICWIMCSEHYLHDLKTLINGWCLVQSGKKRRKHFVFKCEVTS